MKCPRCQHENRAGAKFCEECGLQFTPRCGHCGAELGATAKFCSECGRRADVAPISQLITTPESYMPKHLIEKILTSKGAREGERKQVTVLFADVKGSMELLVDRDPEEARNILDPVLELMMEAVHRYEGTVNQVMGDGIMALFGAPLAHEDHAVRACYAALRMQEATRRYSADLHRAQGVGVQIRIGLNSGEVVVCSIGSDLRTDYTAVGATTHLAARLEQMATPDCIFMTAATYTLAEGYVQVHERGPATVKGLAEPIDIYELIGASGLRTRFQTSLSRGLSPFVGRDTALAELRSAMVRAAGGHGQVVAMLGEPGVGKSRLLYEFVHGTDTRDWLILEGRAFSYRQATPYFPLIDILKAYFQIQDQDDIAKIRDKVAGKLALDETMGTLVPPILALLDVPVDDAGWIALDPRERRQRTLDAYRHLLLRESRVHSVLLILEDLHWVDSETQALLDALVETLAGARILLLVNYRPEYRHDWGGKTYYRQVQLEPLPPEHAQTLIASLLGDSIPAPLISRLVEQTEGNPLFLEECVRSLVESGALVGERGAYRLASNVSGLRVPASVHAILAARIDRLAPEDKALLQAAAVIGKKVPWRLLVAIAGLGEADLRARLARLQSAEFIVEGQLFPDLEYGFRHALTHDVAYASVLQERRATLHGQVIAATERLYAHRLTEHAEVLGHHAVQAQQWDKAVTYLRLAADKARGRSAHQQAITYSEEALKALAHVPHSRERDAQEVDLRIDLRQSFYLLGDLPRSNAILADAESLAEKLGDPRRLGWVALYIGENQRLTGNLAAARRCYERARGLGESAADVELRTAAVHYLGIAAHLAGEYRTSVELLREALERPFSAGGGRLASGSAVAGNAVNAAWLARSLAVLGEFEEAAVQASSAVAAAERVGSAYSLLLTTFALGEVHRERGAIAEALAPLERSVAIAREWQIHLMMTQVTSRLGAAYARAGRFDEGLALLRAASLEVTGESRKTRFPIVMRLLGEVYLLTGDRAEARGCAERALRVAISLGQRGDEAAARWVLACATDSPDAAESAFHDAIELGSALGMRPLVAHCHLDLARLYRRTGRQEQAQEPLTTAAGMYREIGMRLWLEQAEAELAEPR